MSQQLINHYLKELDVIKRVSGSSRETIIREAFKDLLKAWGRQDGLVFLAEFPLKTATKTNINIDGALLHELRMPLGYWEAKDANDDLDAEVSKKFKKGYPQDNIIFSDDAQAVLWQNRQEVMRCDMTDTVALSKLLKLYFSYERAEIAGFRTAVEQFKTDLPAVLEALRAMMDTQVQSNASYRAATAKFLVHAQDAINPSLTDADVREMLIQHILTEEIFAKVFDDSDFHQHNNVAKELYALEAEFFTGALKRQTLKGLETYYAAIRAAAAQISSHSEKQTFLKVIYENFYKVYNTKAADRLGVVYTPNEIVRFMIDGADWLCEQHFGKNLIDKDVDILDPATGTGTYICELLEHFRGQPKKLAHKYAHELHANEVAILPYYVANLNIEATYAAITGQYAEFPNLCFVDTLDNVGLHTAAKGTTAELFGSVSEENVARIKRQNSKRISVVIGNPPYNANQANENDNNKNRKYPGIDARIKQTYIAESTAQKTKLYDMYARFFRWASDRVHENGIVAFVSNNSFIDSRTFDGFRKVIASEFNEIWVVDLKGNARTSGERRRREAGNVFDDQIRVGVAIWFCVKNPKLKGCKIKYQAVSDYAKAQQKIDFIAATPLRDRVFELVRPDPKNNWINLTSNDFDTLLPLASKETKAAKTSRDVKAIFRKFSLGVVTARDEWVYDFDPQKVEDKVRFLIDEYNAERMRLKGVLKERRGLEDRLAYNIKWSRAVKNDLSKSVVYAYAKEFLTKSIYRPFVMEVLYFSKQLNEMQYLQREFFGLNQSNTAMLLDLGGTKPFSALGTDKLPDYHVNGDSVCFPLFRYESGQKVENITDWALKQFTTHYAEEAVKVKGARKITKEAIFHYCYAVLHDPVYREKYAQNLKREFPRIPFYAGFWQWVAWGESLMQMHIGFESVAPFALQRHDQPDTAARNAGLSPKAMLRADTAAGSIALDTETTLRGIPPQAWAYKLGNRSALEWVLDQYKERKPKDPTIREKFDTYRFSDYKEKVIDLLMRVTTVSVETVRVTEAMKGVAR
ncbi:type ISP restriction/modification enzyme [Rhodoferax sp.]|jgi:predicted helicase|uniref:type ISP restriction/modification enzyme n=1 Tax=Rhodoferax sp. TaxID=50421 RepID=UPI0037845D9B